MLLKIKVVELFAGVGGFRLGLERVSKETFKFVWSNQWEPKKKVQYASDCYIKNFGNSNHVCNDIEIVKSQIPKHDLLVGGFPCQDYSVATTNAKGIHGQKGVLWWSINDIISAKKPKYVLLENVDRLLKSPTKQRGRDFGIILWCLNQLGYHVEWRIINAADYGFPQKRRRTFIFAVKKETKWGKFLSKNHGKKEFLYKDSFFAKEFPVENNLPLTLNLENEDNYGSALPKNIKATSDNFSFQFENSGLMVDGKIITKKLASIKSPKTTLSRILQSDVAEEYYIPEEDLETWKYLKGAKKELRKTKDGFEYNYNEGPIPFPDNIDEPARTILTGEGGLTPSRFKHIVFDKKKEAFRILTAIEVERINGFPDNWTEGMPCKWRYFCMGNALVVGVIEKIGRRLSMLE